MAAKKNKELQRTKETQIYGGSRAKPRAYRFSL